MRKDGPSFQQWGITPLKTANTSSGITSPRFTVSYLPPGWRIYRANLRPCPECYCKNPRAHVHWKEMAKSPKTFFRVEDLPKGFQLLDPSHLRQEDLLTLWEFLTSRQKDGQVGLMFSSCDP